MAKLRAVPKEPDDFSESYIKSHRKFPAWKVLVLVLLVACQVGLIFGMIFIQPAPTDEILRYDILVEALDDGSLDITYTFDWKALDNGEALTWIKIGMANPFFSIYEDSVSSNVERVSYYSEGNGLYYTRVDLKRPYHSGEQLTFSFRLNQKEMLCRDGDGYFYEFVPGWFNGIPVRNYVFRWKDPNGILSCNATESLPAAGEHRWMGEMPCGTYVTMKVRYPADAFSAGVKTVKYQPFNASGVENELLGEKVGICVILGILFIVILILEFFLVDCVVSYYRGRGFYCGYGGYHMHLYGRRSTLYDAQRDQYLATHGGGRSGSHGGGCACACACACAGGGRAGCSQKDTWHNETERKDHAPETVTEPGTEAVEKL